MDKEQNTYRRLRVHPQRPKNGRDAIKIITQAGPNKFPTFFFSMVDFAPRHRYTDCIHGKCGRARSMKTQEILDLLQSHRTLGKAPREELEWIVEHGRLLQFGQGDVVAPQTDIVENLYILLKGCVSIHMNRGAGPRRMEWRGGDVTGLLPYSRLQNPPGDTVVDEPTVAIAISRSDLPALIRNCYEATAIMVHEMTDRARRFTSTDLRDEKMRSLGLLAAGLAHEVNNPASAALRGAKSLAGILANADEAARIVCAAGLTGEQLAELDTVRSRCLEPPNPRESSGLLLADREDEIAGWLGTRGLDTELAEDLARTSVTPEGLDRLRRTLEEPALGAALRWIASTCAARSLVVDIERAASRIHSLVGAVKGFTHMGQASDEEPVQITAGLVDSLALLEGKARGKSVAITLDIAPDLPLVQGVSVELNQIWMNLIDNAIDAAPEAGHVTVRASRDGASVLVSVVDDGPGIPPEIKGHIFDPFFTTKDVGEGTGLGLDIVRRIVQWHHGEIQVDSQPGRTEFRVRLPVAGST
jgi:signal transduction histidine kinase